MSLAKADLHAFTAFLHLETAIPLDCREFRKLYAVILSISFIRRSTELKSPGCPSMYQRMKFRGE